jgi:hypothetical protein
MPPAGFFLSSYTLLLLHPYLSCILPFVFTFNTHNTNIHAPAGFEPATPASDRPQTIAFDRLDAGIVTQQKLQLFNLQKH